MLVEKNNAEGGLARRGVGRAETPWQTGERWIAPFGRVSMCASRAPENEGMRHPETCQPGPADARRLKPKSRNLLEN